MRKKQILGEIAEPSVKADNLIVQFRMKNSQFSLFIIHCYSFEYVERLTTALERESYKVLYGCFPFSFDSLDDVSHIKNL